MHHTSLPISPPNLTSHIDKTLDLPMQIAIWDITAIFAPLAREDTFTRRIGRHWWDGWVADEGELAFLVQPCPAADAGREELVLEGGVDYSDYGTMLVDEGNGDAEHGENMRVVYGSWEESVTVIVGQEGDDTVQRIDTPRWVFID